MPQPQPWSSLHFANTSPLTPKAYPRPPKNEWLWFFSAVTLFLFFASNPRAEDALILLASLLGVFGFFYLDNKQLRKLLAVTIGLYLAYALTISAWTLALSCVADYIGLFIGYFRLLSSERKARQQAPAEACSPP